MAYSIYFTNEDNLYLEVGFDTKKAAKKKLEEIANCFPDDKAVGEIWQRNSYLDKTTHYEITYDNRKAKLCYKNCKKVFNAQKAY
jgi:hypothetical protein